MDSRVCGPDGTNLFCRLDEVAVPELYSDKLDMDNVEEDEEEAILFDTVAMPEVHLGACRVHLGR